MYQCIRINDVNRKQLAVLLNSAADNEIMPFSLGNILVLDTWFIALQQEKTPVVTLVVYMSVSDIISG